MAMSGSYESGSNLFSVNGTWIGKQKPRSPWLDKCKERVLKAIADGNNEPKYIEEYITSGARVNQRYDLYMGEAIKELVEENKIYYNELLEGYYKS